MAATEQLFTEDAYARTCEACVTHSAPGAIQFDRTVFYPAGGGQPGDSGAVKLADGTTIPILDTVKGEGIGEILHIVPDDASIPAIGTAVTVEIDWARRHKHMRMHTCLHLLCAVIEAPVTGGQLSEDKARLDFDLSELSIDKAEIEALLNRLIARDAPTTTRWISDTDLAAQPDLVRTMKVKPPSGQGRVRLLDIADVDLQPCGGTHVKSTGEIGPITVRKIENKGKHNRRINIIFKEPE
ncbi:MAG: alanyl-tRNA editing protein [Proteobacteria bacterium]|nr:alanyl-tRNA editing protein [Pseudomonadota bacterium]MDA1356311.1 alanyl-tRNA editing protein [Pseudomonadota bacterium]